jgi:glycerate 2-kinase
VTFEGTLAWGRGDSPERDLCLSLLEGALFAIQPQTLTAAALARALPNGVLAPFERVVVLALGKASVGMLEGAWDALGRRMKSIVLCVPEGYESGAPHSLGGVTVETFQGGHPLANERSLEAGKALLAAASELTETTLGVVLLSGGASACAEVLRAGKTLDELRQASTTLLANGATIAEFHAGRAAFSELKAGGLSRAASKATLFTFAISDVGPDEEAILGGGPTLPAASPRHHFQIIASGDTARAAAVETAHSLGLVLREDLAPTTAPALRGEASDAGALWGSRARQLLPGQCLIATGETTVTLDGESGKGGRNQEFALAAAMAIRGVPGLALACFATDGRDGPTNAAGALVDSVTVRTPVDAEHALRGHDAYPFLDKSGDLLRTAATGTNVADVMVAVRV